MRKKVKNMSRRQQRAVFADIKNPKRARDYGDDPRIRHSYGEHKTKNKEEPWE